MATYFSVKLVSAIAKRLILRLCFATTNSRMTYEGSICLWTTDASVFM